MKALSINLSGKSLSKILEQMGAGERRLKISPKFAQITGKFGVFVF
jgi:hypothetical protein